MSALAYIRYMFDMRKPLFLQAQAIPCPIAIPGMKYTFDLDKYRIDLEWHIEDQVAWRRVLDAIKNIPGRRYSSATKKWSVPNTKEMRDWCRASGWQIPEPEIVNRPPPPYIKERVLPGLYPYQEDFLKFSLTRPRLALFDEQGTGKTVQALAWLRYHGLLPALIVVTSSTKGQWAANYKAWLGRDDVEVLSGERPYQLEPGKSYVINWDILYKWERSPLRQNFYAQGFKALVGDEVQAIGNRTSQRTKAFMRLATRIPCLLAMSGTPARSRPVQLWPTLHSIDPATFPDFYAYANRYCNPKVGPYGTEYKGISNGPELHALLSTRSLRRTKAEVMAFLPPKIITTVPCSVDKGKMEAYREQAKKAREASEFEKSAAIAGLFRSAYDLKADACKQWIMDFLSTDEKLLVFAWHHAVVADIAGFLKDKGIGAHVLTGETSGAQRDKIKESFINDPNIRVIVANIQSAGVGIDGLQKACSNCVFVEFTAAPTDHWQAEDRLHRGGQGVPVNVYYLVAPRTIDVTMAYQLDSKAVALASALDGTDSHIVKISDMIKKKK